MTRLLTLLIFSFGLAGVTLGGAVAQSGGTDQLLDDYFGACAAATSTYEIQDCLDKQYERADGQLNAIWPRVQRYIASRDDVPPDMRRDWKKSLLNAQRAWVSYKENECKGSAPFKYFGGTQASIESLGCMLRLTVLRLQELRDYLNQ